MKTLNYILILSFFFSEGSAHNSPNEAHQLLKKELREINESKLELKIHNMKNEEERILEENKLWLQLLGYRHVKGKGDVTPEEKKLVWSIFQNSGNNENSEKGHALDALTFVEEIEKWEPHLIEMLHRNEKHFVIFAIEILRGRLDMGSERQKFLLTNNPKISSRIEELESSWVEDANFQTKLKDTRSL